MLEHLRSHLLEIVLLLEIFSLLVKIRLLEQMALDVPLLLLVWSLLLRGLLRGLHQPLHLPLRHQPGISLVLNLLRLKQSDVPVDARANLHVIDLVKAEVGV